MIVKNPQFEISAVSPKQYPKNDLPEIVLVGKSNVGKSSFVNTMINRKKLARTSSEPGKTRQINFYNIDEKFYFVDLPGYGFAKHSKSITQRLEKMISSYILQREQLVTVFVLIDVRHEQQKIDREFIDWLGESNVPFTIIFTKSDKLGPGKAKQNAQDWMNKLKDRWETLPPYFITSSEKKSGKEEVLDYIDGINKNL